MQSLLSVLGVLFFLAAVLGLINPGLVYRWGEKRTRPRAFALYFVLFMTVTMIGGATGEVEQAETVKPEKKEEAAQPAKAAAEKKAVEPQEQRQDEKKSSQTDSGKVLKTKWKNEKVKRDIKFSIDAVVDSEKKIVPTKNDLMATARHIGGFYEAKNKFISFYLPGTELSTGGPFAIYYYYSDSAEKYLDDSSKKESLSVFSSRIPDGFQAQEKLQKNKKPAPAQSAGEMPAAVLSGIKERAKEQYPGDFATQKYIIGEQRAAWRRLQERICPGAAEKIEIEIKKRAARDYPGDYATQVYIAAEQCRACRAIPEYKPQSVPPEVLAKIKGKAAQDYPGDYATQLYIIKEQVGAYNDIQ